MSKWIILIVVFSSGCGLFKAMPDTSSASDQTKSTAASDNRMNIWEAAALTETPDLETYSGHCITAPNEGFLNNAGEICRVVEQHYDAKDDICSEKIACERNESDSGLVE